MTGPFGAGQGIVQLHPTLRCNLRCAHCYSESGPRAGGAIGLDVALDVLADAAPLGFTRLSISGGEPTLYRDLAPLVRSAKQLGYAVGLVSNGTAVARARLTPLAGVVDTIAISLDGIGDTHNDLRKSARSFDEAVETLRTLSAEGATTGVVHTVTGRSLPQLWEIAELAVDVGARLLHLHPLERYGRAVDEAADHVLDAGLRNRLYVQAAALRALQTELAVHVDLIARSQLLAQPGFFYADGPDRRFRIGGLVVSPTGAVMPLSYGIHGRFQVGDLTHERLATAWPRFTEAVEPTLREVCERTIERIRLDETQLAIPWHETLVDESARWTQERRSGGDVAVAGPRRVSLPAARAR